MERKKVFLVKKDPELGAADDNWIYMNSFEFMKFMKTEDGKKRKDCFGKIEAAEDDDCIYYVECGREKALIQDRENKARAYSRKLEKDSGYLTVSCNEMICADDDEVERIEMIADEDMDTIAMALLCLEKEALNEALALLSHEERTVIEGMYLGGEPLSDRKYAEKAGLSRKAVRCRHSRALEQLREYFREKKLF